ncbi:MAG: GAF domain-containing protein [Terriglobales bacterium]
MTGTAADRTASSQTLAETELDSALQLLVERAQYITGATGAALALPQAEEMVCRASAGSSAPAVGARLQVRSGLTGESIARRQLLRCDNAEADPRVNLEACRALGIASIVVLPLLRRNGEVRGLFELFSDHPYAFEERDLIALERMADLTLTALDLAEQRQNAVPSAVAPKRAPEPIASSATPAPPAIPIQPELTEPPVPPAELHPTDVHPAEVHPADALPATPAEIPPLAPAAAAESAPALVPQAMLRVQKCSSCGFPVSEGRTLCLDCEKKESETKAFEKKQRETEQARIAQEKAKQAEQDASANPSPDASSTALSSTPADSSVSSEEEFLPAFLANAVPVKESWLANHVNLLAVIVLILGVLVAIVVFR